MADLLAHGFDRQVAEQVLAARLAAILERRAGAAHDLSGDADEFTILVGLSPLPLRRV